MISFVSTNAGSKIYCSIEHAKQDKFFGSQTHDTFTYSPFNDCETCEGSDTNGNPCTIIIHSVVCNCDQIEKDTQERYAADWDNANMDGTR